MAHLSCRMQDSNNTLLIHRREGVELLHDFGGAWVTRVTFSLQLWWDWLKFFTSIFLRPRTCSQRIRWTVVPFWLQWASFWRLMTFRWCWMQTTPQKVQVPPSCPHFSLSLWLFLILCLTQEDFLLWLTRENHTVLINCPKNTRHSGELRLLTWLAWVTECLVNQINGKIKLYVTGYTPVPVKRTTHHHKM